MGAEWMESKTLLRDREPLVKNTTNRIKDLFLLRAEQLPLEQTERTATATCTILSAAAFIALPPTLWAAVI